MSDKLKNIFGVSCRYFNQFHWQFILSLSKDTLVHKLFIQQGFDKLSLTSISTINNN